MHDLLFSYDEALEITYRHISPLEADHVELRELVNRVAAVDIVSLVDSPSVDVSFKDGYAICSADIAHASPETPARLLLVGHASAGNSWIGEIVPGTAIRILSGAPIPPGADAVIAEEFTVADGDYVTVMNDAHPGRNILPKGCDIAIGQTVCVAGQLLTPTQVGLLAAAGHMTIPVVKRPRVAIIATGDEVIAPGMPLQEGKLFASNLVTLAAWCSHYGMDVTTRVVADNAASIRNELASAIASHDALVTSGGSWKGEHDLVVGLLDEMRWAKYYHRIRIGPGKAVGFGLLEDKPVFCLPGGPPSNHIAFLELALPGLMKLGGHSNPGLPKMNVQLNDDVHGQVDWTQFIHGTLEHRPDTILFHSLKSMTSRLRMMAQAEAIVKIPEGTAHIAAGTVLEAQMLR